LSRGVGPAPHGGRRREFADKYGLKPAAILDFSVNINPLGPSSKAIKAIESSLDNIAAYPDDYLKLKESLAAYIGVDKANIVAGNGSIELIYLLISVYRPRKVFIFTPTFTEYERAARIGGAEVINVYLTDDYQHLKALDGLDLNEADMVFICNPNNPSGALFTAGEIGEIATLAPRALIVVDEAFMDFVERQEEYSLSQKAVSAQNIIVLRSMGKFFALAGLRLGYLIINRAAAEYLSLRQPPWNINNLAVTAAITALGDKEYISRTRRGNRRLRKDYYQRLALISGLSVFPSNANFLLAKISRARISADMLQDKLAFHNIMIRTATDFKGLDESYFRLAVRGEVDNRFLVDKLGEALG